MRKVLYFAGMALVAASVLVACEKDPGEDNGNGGDVVRLAIPQPSFTDTTETSVTVAWAAVENAASYTYMLNNEENTTTETSVVIETPEAGDYTFRVKSVPAEGSTEFAESQWSSTITYEYKGQVQDPSEGISEWLGTYTLTSSHTMNVILTEADEIEVTYNPQPLTREITIAPYDYDPNFALVSGLSDIELQDQSGNTFPAPAYATLSEDGSEFWLIGYAEGFEVGSVSFQGDETPYPMYFFGFTYDQSFGIIMSDVTFILTRDGDSIKAVGNAGSLTDGSQFQIVAVDIMALTGSSSVNWLSYPTELPGGTWTLEKTSDQYSAHAFRHNISAMKTLGTKVFEPMSFSVAK